MSLELKAQLSDLLAAPETSGSIATLDEAGVPYSVPSPFLHLDDDGRFVHLELLETSHSHRNLLRSIWFDRPVSITLSNRDGKVTVITGRPFKAHVSGQLFSNYYSEVRSRVGDADLAAVWLIEPQQISDETYSVRKAKEELLHPFHLHLDRLAVQFS